MNKFNILKLAKLIAKFAEVKTDKATLTIDGELEVGAEVFVESEGEYVEAQAGEYVLEDGKILVIEDGKIKEIKDAETKQEDEEEMNKTDENAQKLEFTATKEKFEATYQEVQTNIYRAIEESGVYGYILENTDSYAIVSVWGNDDMEHLYKYQISVAEDGKVTLGEMVEVHIEYVADVKTEEVETKMAENEEVSDEKETKIAELEARIAELESEVAEKDAKIEEMQKTIDESNKPLEEPVKLSKTLTSAKVVDNKALRYFE